MVSAEEVWESSEGCEGGIAIHESSRSSAGIRECGDLGVRGVRGSEFMENLLPIDRYMIYVISINTPSAHLGLGLGFRDMSAFTVFDRG